MDIEVDIEERNSLSEGDSITKDGAVESPRESE